MLAGTTSVENGSALASTVPVGKVHEVSPMQLPFSSHPEAHVLDLQHRPLGAHFEIMFTG